MFVGAGLSRSAGYVDWNGLLSDIASDLNLDVTKETDLVAVAQYHYNKNGRGRINQILINELTKEAERNENHELLARLPIATVWTTNYDQILEQAFKEAGKVVDVKLTSENLAQTRSGRDVVIYKMHGCVTQPHEAVITKDDYERYELTRSLFAESLKGDLISKTFLFLGFSFTDPNIDYILGRVRVLLGKNQREHFCIMRKPLCPKKLSGKQKAEFEYEQRKLELRQEDLRRFGIEIVWIEEFEHLVPLLRALTGYVHRKSVFVSGAAKDAAPLGSPRLENLCRNLGTRMIHEGYKLVSGFGRGLGEYCVLGALGALYETVKGADANRVLVRPFPRSPQANQQTSQNTRHREDLLSRVGCLVVVAGNRDDNKGGIEVSPGVIEEVEIAKRQNKFIIPIGTTGHAAEEVWKRATANPGEYLPGLNVNSKLAVLGNSGASDDELLDAVFAILREAETSLANK